MPLRQWATPVGSSDGAAEDEPEPEPEARDESTGGELDGSSDVESLECLLEARATPISTP